jgi:hypothetical protein
MRTYIDENITKIQQFVSKNYVAVIEKDRHVGATTALLNYAMFHAQFGDRILFVAPTTALAMTLRDIVAKVMPKLVNSVKVVSGGYVEYGFKGESVDTIIIDDAKITSNMLATLLPMLMDREGQIIVSTERIPLGISYLQAAPRLRVRGY